VFKKCRENPDDILFVDASAYFEKATNQNLLREEDVEKIISTYRQRLQEDKYSYRAPLSEIEENGFNLNIQRYVDTFEEEEPIDLSEVVRELRKVKQDMKKTDQLILEFCNELGIEAPL